MSKTGKVTLPKLAGSLLELTNWRELFGLSGYRIYPMQVGATVRGDTTSAVVLTDGMGEFAVNDYVMVCTRTSYGDSDLYIPNIAQIGRISSFGANSAATQTAADDDRLNLTASLVAYEDDYLLNLGADGASNPLIQPNYDGGLGLYYDPAGNEGYSADYLLSGQGGIFRAWVASGRSIVDLLISSSGGAPQAVVPYFALGPEIDA